MAYIGQTPTAVALDGDDLANDIITLAKMASGTDGNIISYDASGNPVAIATGSDGQVLTSAGAGAAPAFAGGGKVLQVVETHITAGQSQSIDAATTTAITNFAAAITPAASSSKIMIWVSWAGELSNNTQNKCILGLKRDSTALGEAASPGDRVNGLFPIAVSWGQGSDNDSTPESSAFQFLDSPSTGSEITYTVTVKNGAATTFYTNRTVADTDSAAYARTTSTLTLMEIGA